MIPTKEQIEALATALRSAAERTDMDDPTTVGHEVHLAWATAILAALDGWTLVPTNLGLGPYWRKRIAEQEAEIARLRAALEIIAVRPEPGYDASALVVTARNIAHAALAQETKP